jgi:hypothetical protein
MLALGKQAGTRQAGPPPISAGLHTLVDQLEESSSRLHEGLGLLEERLAPIMTPGPERERLPQDSLREGPRPGEGCPLGSRLGALLDSLTQCEGRLRDYTQRLEL